MNDTLSKPATRASTKFVCLFISVFLLTYVVYRAYAIGFTHE